MLKKLIIFLFLLCISVKPVLAQNIIKDTQDAIKTPGTQENWLYGAFVTNLVTIQTALGGEIPFNPDGTVSENYAPGGMVGFLNNSVSTLMVPIYSGSAYISEKSHSLFAKTSYAQSDTQGAVYRLKPLLMFWTMMRNFVFLIVSIIFIFLSFAIMLRIKVSSNAIVTIQNSIPKVLIAIVLVSFSYAIAGLIIDLSYLVSGIVIYFLYRIPEGDLGVGMFQIFGKKYWYDYVNITQSNFQDLVTNTFPGVNAGHLSAWFVKVVLNGIIGGIMSPLNQIPVLNNLAPMHKVTQEIISTAGGLILGWTLGYILFSIVLYIMVIIWTIKLFFGLLKTYVGVIVRIMIAPLEIIAGAFPGSKIGFGSWFKAVFAGALVFPGVTIFLMFMNYIQNIAQGTPLPGIGTGGGLWTPGILGSWGVSSAGLVSGAIGILALSLLPKLPDMIPQIIFNIKPSPYGSGLDQEMKQATNMAKKGFDRGVSYADDNIPKGTTNKFLGPVRDGIDWAKKMKFIK